MKGKGNGYAGRLLSLLLSLMLVISMAPAVVFAAGSGDGGSGDAGLAEGTYAPGEVIVMFKDGAVRESKTSIRSARSLKIAGDDFGETLGASGDSAEAARDIRSEGAIVGDSLGSSFVIEDSLYFGDEEASDSSGSAGMLGISSEDADDEESSEDGLRVALVSSDRYTTEQMIEMLSKNDDVAAVEPNSYLHFEDYDSYSLNDRYSGYLYQDNAPAATNREGKSVYARGEDPEAAVSANAASGWKRLPADGKEVVIAVVDTGINLEHEDLVSRLWTNPGDIGLAGEHGYNFADNNTELMDHAGHGSHCAGIIAAAANNGKGVAGVAGDANVKIMMLKTESDTDEGKMFTAMGAFNYVIKAKQRGVNVVATSNSWGRGDSQSTIFNEIVDRMGENGILTFTAAGNDTKDLDRATDNPASNESPYGINVGAAGISGKPAGFSNYGRTGVDIFAPGVNILSTVGYKCYFPDIYNNSELRKTTEFFGIFDKNSRVRNNKITPTDGNVLGVYEFGAFEFHKQAADDEQESKVPDTAKCEISLSKGHCFTDDPDRRTLKVTITGVQSDEEYYVFFPFDKRPSMNGDNTRFSIMYQSGETTDGASAEVYGGEIVKDDSGRYDITGQGKIGHGISAKQFGVDTHLFNNPGAEVGGTAISDYERGKKTGIGLRIEPTRKDDEAETVSDRSQGTLVLYIDSVAVSVPDADIDLSTSYEMMSGTSMACPAAAGTCALMASIYPRQDYQTGAGYAEFIRNKLYSCVTQTDELKGLCSTGGYIDFRNLTVDKPVISDASCDLDAGTLTLTGENMEPGMELSYRRIAEKDSHAVVLPAEGMTVDFAADGRSVVIGNAWKLFGSYLEFSLKSVDGRSGVRSFFTVKGQKEPEKVAGEYFPHPEDDNYVDKKVLSILTDGRGKVLYGFDLRSSALYRFNGKDFNRVYNGDLIKTVEQKLIDEGFNDYDLENNVRINPDNREKPLVDGDMLYSFVSYTFEDMSGDGSTKEERYIACMDLSAAEPEWTLIDDECGVIDKLGSGRSYEMVDGKMYFATNDYDFYCFDMRTQELTQKTSLPEELYMPFLIEYKGCIYMFFGADRDYKGSDLRDSISDRVYRYDMKNDKWYLNGEGALKYMGKFDSGFGYVEMQTVGCATEKGIAFINMSIDGAGNVSIYDPDTNTVTPLYYTFNNGVSDQPLWGTPSCAVTDKGIYYSRDDSNEMRRGYGLWLIPASAYSGGGEPVDPPAPVGPADDQAAALAFNGVYDASIPAVKSAKVKASKKSFTASWKKQSKKKLKKFQKVEIQYSRDKKFPMNGTKIKFAKKTKTSCKIKGLSKKKTYWVRVRNVKFVNGTKYVGKWSKAKKIRTK